jgi:hypothetical protein
LTDAASSPDHHHRPLEKTAIEDKLAPVIVKLGKADGMYYNKKDEKKHNKQNEDINTTNKKVTLNPAKTLAASKGFTTANFTEAVVTSNSSVSATLFGSEEKVKRFFFRFSLPRNFSIFSLKFPRFLR